MSQAQLDREVGAFDGRERDLHSFDGVQSDEYSLFAANAQKVYAAHGPTLPEGVECRVFRPGASQGCLNLKVKPFRFALTTVRTES